MRYWRLPTLEICRRYMAAAMSGCAAAVAAVGDVVY